MHCLFKTRARFIVHDFKFEYSLSFQIVITYIYILTRFQKETQMKSNNAN